MHYSKSASSPATVAGAAIAVCPAINSTFTQGNTPVAVSGTVDNAAAGIGTIRLYFDGTLVGTQVISTTGPAEPWSINSLYAPYAGAVVNATFQAGTNAEYTACAAGSASYKTAACTSPSAPVITPASATIIAGTSVTFALSNIVSATWYAVMDNTGTSYATSAYSGNTAGFSITTKTFNTPGTYNLKVSADQLSGCASSFSAASIQVNAATLPVRFVQVRANHKDDKTLIEWQVADEAGVAYYSVEKSTGCINFVSLGQVAYQPSTQNTNSYSFTDSSAQMGGKVCYRIKEVDINGSFSYSTIVSTDTERGNLLATWPNPAHSKTTITVSALQKENASLSLIDMWGKIVFSKSVQLQSGYNTFYIADLVKYGKGTFIVRLESGIGLQFTKLVIQ